MYLLAIESDDAESIINILCVAGRLGVRSAVVDAEESIPLQSKSLDIAITHKSEAIQSSPIKSDSGDWDVLMSLVNDKQLTLLRAIRSNSEGVGIQGLANAIGETDLRAVGGVLGAGLKHNILKSGFKDGEVIITKGYGESRVYVSGPILLSHDLQSTDIGVSKDEEGDADEGNPIVEAPLTPIVNKRKVHPRGESNAPRLIDAIQMVMCDRSLNSKQIYDLLESRGWLPNSNHPMNYIRCALSSNGVFKRSGERGVYHLDSTNPYYSSRAKPDQRPSKYPIAMGTESPSKDSTHLAPGPTNSGSLSLEDSQVIVDQIMSNEVPLD